MVGGAAWSSAFGPYSRHGRRLREEQEERLREQRELELSSEIHRGFALIQETPGGVVTAYRNIRYYRDKIPTYIGINWDDVERKIAEKGDHGDITTEEFDREYAKEAREKQRGPGSEVSSYKIEELPPVGNPPYLYHSYGITVGYPREEDIFYDISAHSEEEMRNQLEQVREWYKEDIDKGAQVIISHWVSEHR